MTVEAPPVEIAVPITVETPAAEPVETSDDDGATVIILAPNDDAPAQISATDLDQEGRIIRLETAVGELRGAVFDLQVTAVEPVPEPQPLPEPVPVPVETDDDGEESEPRSARSHWLFRSRNDWKGGK